MRSYCTYLEIPSNNTSNQIIYFFAHVTIFKKEYFLLIVALSNLGFYNTESCLQQQLVFLNHTYWKPVVRTLILLTDFCIFLSSFSYVLTSSLELCWPHRRWKAIKKKLFKHIKLSAGKSHLKLQKQTDIQHWKICKYLNYVHMRIFGILHFAFHSLEPNANQRY